MRAFSILATLALIPLSLAMGRSHGTAANLLSRSEDADTLAGPLTNDTLFANKMQTPGGKWHQPGQKCSGNPLRDPKDHCHCKPGLKDIDGSCCCGDSANTLLTLQGCKFGGGGCDQPVCVCEDKWAQYDNEKKECFCPPGTVAVHEPDGKLKCKRQEPSPRSNARRGIVDAIAEHREDSMESIVSLESVMQCRVGEKACKVGPAFVCTDVSSDLAACGACPGEAEDCASLSGVDEVRCDRGRCVIDSCQRGFTLTPAPTRADPTSNLPAFICKAKTASSSSSWLNFQRHAGEV